MGVSTTPPRLLLPPLLLLLSTLLVPCAPSVVEEHRLSAMHGSVRSSGYPKPYPNEARQTWRISVPSGYRVRLQFTSFDVETSFGCEYDYIKVEVTNEILGQFCGRENGNTAPKAEPMVTPGNVVDITFVSDFSNDERYTGFEVYFTAVDIDECEEYARVDELACDHNCFNYPGGFQCSCQYGYVLADDNRSCTVECSNLVFTERQGELSSPDYPRPYPRALQCKFTLRLEEGFTFSLAFQGPFDVETHNEIDTCPYDSLTIRSGGKEWGPLCGTTLPDPIETRGFEVEVVFRSDTSGQNKGWNLRYTAKSIPCSHVTAPVHGSIEPVQATYSFKDEVVFSCDIGYRLIQQEDGKEVPATLQVECQKDGTWSREPPTCRIVDCGKPAQPNKGFCGSPDVTTYKSETDCGCIDAYHFTTEMNGVFICNESGHWTDPRSGEKVPKCEPVCGEPKHVIMELSRVVGGRSARPGNFPWQVLVKFMSGRMLGGGGALLGDRWVLTAAHVVEDYAANETTVILGSMKRVSLNDNLLGSTQHYTVDKIISHPGYDPKSTGYDNDIALIRLAGDAVTMTDSVRPICLPTVVAGGRVNPELSPNDVAFVSGWGRTAGTLGARLADTLQYVDLPVVPQVECERANSGKWIAELNTNSTVTENMFCAGYSEGGKDSCQGDSGGPIVVVQDTKWFTVGVVSWGMGCAKPGLYGVYTRVDKYLGWLRDEMEKNAVKSDY
uniref:Mannan-binding lectin serine protease 1-like n=1 Tax=Petromyzon marinus TaxID=7757 RepID=A0AAJ7THQ1_PETMA|nr:mannan-binding lectin serine protease 1-like [Petromyzon marinus]